jgi:hypothetical protein
MVLGMYTSFFDWCVFTLRGICNWRSNLPLCPCSLWHPTFWTITVSRFGLWKKQRLRYWNRAMFGWRCIFCGSGVRGWEPGVGLLLVFSEYLNFRFCFSNVEQIPEKKIQFSQEKNYGVHTPRKKKGRVVKQTKGERAEDNLLNKQFSNLKRPKQSIFSTPSKISQTVNSANGLRQTDVSIFYVVQTELSRADMRLPGRDVS